MHFKSFLLETVSACQLLVANGSYPYPYPFLWICHRPATREADGRQLASSCTQGGHARSRAITSATSISLTAVLIDVFTIRRAHNAIG